MPVSGLSCGQSTSLALCCRAFFMRVLRVVSFISRLTAAHLPRTTPQALHEIIVSLVGRRGISSRPPHFLQLNLRKGDSVLTVLPIAKLSVQAAEQPNQKNDRDWDTK